MKLTINSKEALKAVQLVGSLIKGPHAMPILDNVLLSVNNNILTIVADNLEVRSQVEVPVECKGPLSVCLPYKLLSNILKGFANEPIDFDFTEKEVVLKSATGTYKLPIVPSKEFPDNKKNLTGNEIEVNSLEFIKAIKRAALFTDKGNTTLDNLDNILISITETGTRIVSTDKRMIFENEVISKGKPEKLMLTEGAAAYFIQSITSDEAIKIFHTGNHIVLKLENREISAILSNTTFPNYEKVFETLKMDKTLKLDKDAILPALNRLFNITDQVNNTLIFSLNENSLELSFHHELQKFDAVEKISCEYMGEPIKIGFNANYLKNILTAIDDEITIELSKSNVPCKVFSKNTRAIMSPIML